MDNGRPSTYLDPTYGFAIQPPHFPAGFAGSTVAPVTFCGPSEGVICSNVNVVVQNVRMTRSEYWELTLAQFSEAGFHAAAVVERTVSGRDALIVEYEGNPEGQELRFLALAVFDFDRVLLVTCTALRDSFPEYEQEFRACLESFRIRDSNQRRKQPDGDGFVNRVFATDDVIDLALQSSLADSAQPECADIADTVEPSGRTLLPQPSKQDREDLVCPTSEQAAAAAAAKQQVERNLDNKREEVAARQASELARMKEIHRHREEEHERRKAEFQSRHGRDHLPGTGLNPT